MICVLNEKNTYFFYGFCGSVNNKKNIGSIPFNEISIQNCFHWDL